MRISDPHAAALLSPATRQSRERERERERERDRERAPPRAIRAFTPSPLWGEGWGEGPRQPGNRRKCPHSRSPPSCAGVSESPVPRPEMRWNRLRPSSRGVTQKAARGVTGITKMRTKVVGICLTSRRGVPTPQTAIRRFKFFHRSTQLHTSRKQPPPSPRPTAKRHLRRTPWTANNSWLKSAKPT